MIELEHNPSPKISAAADNECTRIKTSVSIRTGANSFGVGAFLCLVMRRNETTSVKPTLFQMNQDVSKKKIALKGCDSSPWVQPLSRRQPIKLKGDAISIKWRRITRRVATKTQLGINQLNIFSFQFFQM